MRLTEEEVRERLLSPRFRRRQFSGLLLDQAFLAGLGNYLRVEILWEAELAPQHRAQDLTEPQLRRLSQALLAIPRHSYRMRGTMKSAHHEAAFRFKVFHRAGKTCERCGGVIEKSTLSSRPFTGVPAASFSAVQTIKRARRPFRRRCLSAGDKDRRAKRPAPWKARDELAGMPSFASLRTDLVSRAIA